MRFPFPRSPAFSSSSCILFSTMSSNNNKLFDFPLQSPKMFASSSSTSSTSSSSSSSDSPYRPFFFATAAVAATYMAYSFYRFLYPNTNTPPDSPSPSPSSSDLPPLSSSPSTSPSSSLSSPSIRPLVICGPSGVGKGTLLARLRKDFPDYVGKSISHTTRKPRGDEINGIHYHFVDKKVMESEIQNNKFIEFADVHGNYYGTSFAAVENVSREGKICVMEIDIQGAQNVKKTKLNPIFIFISPPNFPALKQRLQIRGTETEETIQRRLQTAESEMKFFTENPNFFDDYLVNDELENAYTQLRAKIVKLYPQLKYNPLVLQRNNTR